ncbi:cytochrome P450 [Mycena filopes]|nr:cytochrome P450 [Mycena filopes]
MESVSPLSAGIFAAAAVACYFALCKSRSPSPVARLAGPPTPSWIYGNMLQLVFPRTYGEFEFEWQKKYGSLYRIKGMFGEDRLMISDPVSLQYIITSRSVVRSPSQWQVGTLIFGEQSVYCVEGEDHRRLRAALGPGFAPAAVRNFSVIFSDVAQRIVQEWDHATLDIISEAALGLPLNTVADPKHPLAQSHLHVISMAFNRSKGDLFGDVVLPHIPTFVLRAASHLPTAAFRALKRFRSVTDAMGASLIQTKTAEEKNGDLDDAQDVISILIRALSQRKQRVTAKELSEQIRIVLLGGQDTSADALAWCFYELAKDVEFQEKLRAEVESRRNSSDGGQMDYDSMPLLNAFLKEILRMYPAAPYLERVAAEDLVIPLESEIITTSGERISQLPVKKGQFINVAIASYQRLEALWGSDADEFKPSRWMNGDPCKGNAVGPYAHLLTFSGGHRVCAGWRFAVLEMQILLAELVFNFTFSPSKDDPVRPLYAGILVPITEKGIKGLPLFVERVQR